jgi:putative heme transporter
MALFSDATPGLTVGPTVAVAAGLAVLSGLVAATLSRPALTERVGESLDRVVGGVLKRTGSTRPVRIGAALVDLRAGCSHIVRTRWLRLSLGTTLYTALLFALLWACLAITGAGVGPMVVLAGFTVERLLTLAGLTPGGAGVVEVGLTGVLIALGGAPAGVVAGVLLYRALTYGLEIPVGGVGLATWLWLRRRALTGVPDRVT